MPTTSIHAMAPNAFLRVRTAQSRHFTWFLQMSNLAKRGAQTLQGALAFTTLLQLRIMARTGAVVCQIWVLMKEKELIWMTTVT